MDEEISLIAKNQTWKLCPLPAGKQAITSKCVYKTKHGPEDGQIKLKARLVARGFQQRKGIDFHETFAPVVKWSTVRAATCLAASKGWTIHQMDVKTAFLNGELKEKVYMEQPLGFTAPGQTHLVCELTKSLYGLRQSQREWYEVIDNEIKLHGMTKSQADHNLYIIKEGDSITILALYVDDLFITGNDESKITWIKRKLSQRFEMVDLGRMRKFLGIIFTQSIDGIALDQTRYAKELLIEFDMWDSKPSPIPLPEGLKLWSNMDSSYVDIHNYCRLVGKLILVITRADIAYVVNVISRYMSEPQETHLNVAKHILRYIRGTLDYGILYRRGGNTEITGYTDADWGSD
jgi:hypothetical protein